MFIEFAVFWVFLCAFVAFIIRPYWHDEVIFWNPFYMKE